MYMNNFLFLWHDKFFLIIYILSHDNILDPSNNNSIDTKKILTVFEYIYFFKNLHVIHIIEDCWQIISIVYVCFNKQVAYDH